MPRATAKCDYCEWTDVVEARDGDLDAIVAAAAALRDRIIAHFEATHPDLVAPRSTPPVLFDMTDRKPAPEPAPGLARWCFTFGCGSPLSKYYVAIDAVDENQARCRMFALFSHHWASVYSWPAFQRQIAEYGYRELEITRSAGLRLGTMHDEIPLEIYNAAFPW